jgi:predicted RNA binding protein YcfA (HicA-like mRNA interferase family)
MGETMSNKGDIEKIKRALIREGFHLARSNTHLVYRKTGERNVTIPGSIGRGRGLQNLRAQLKRRELI